MQETPRSFQALKFFLQMKSYSVLNAVLTNIMTEYLALIKKRYLLYQGWLRELRNLLLSWSGLALHLLVGPPLVFIDQGVKINTEKYIEDILEHALEPWATKHFEGRHWVFQQDSAPAHRAKNNLELVKRPFSGHNLPFGMDSLISRFESNGL